MRLFNKSIYKILFFIVATTLMLYPIMPNEFLPFKINDKFEHASVFFLMSLLLNRASDTRKHRIRNITVLFFFGILIESIQHFIPHRSASIYDALANLTGILVFQLMFSIYLYNKRKKGINITNIKI